MPLHELISQPITGIRPFDELPINAEIWREAHGQHHLHRQIHAAAAHRPGVVYGLEVVASATKAATLVVAPGVAIDSEGRTLIVSDPVTFTLAEARQIYVTLAFQKVKDPDSAVSVGGGQDYFREVEGYVLQPTKELPTSAYVELARVFRTGADKPIKDAANPFDPKNDEINLLFRPVAFPRCYADCGVGELSYVPKTNESPWNPNRAGLWNLLREGNGRGFHLAFTGPINLRAQVPAASEPALLYVAGRQGFQALADAEIEGLRRYLDGGGLLFGEASGGAADFAAGFQELAGKLGANLKKVSKGHPLLTAHYVFAAAPPGAQGGGSLSLDSERGVLFGTYDYGSAWQGDTEKPDAPDARERIRQAQEFGLNIVAYAANRRRTRELAQLE